MYNTSGVEAIATITELRSKTSALIDYVQQNQKGVLIQKNNEPYAVLLDWQTYQRMTGAQAESKGEEDRPPQKRTRQQPAGKGTGSKSN